MVVIRKSLLVPAIVAALSGCASTSPYQVRGVEGAASDVALGELIIPQCKEVPPEFQRHVRNARQTVEARSIEKYNFSWNMDSAAYSGGFSLGILEFSDAGYTNPEQRRQVFELLDQETSLGPNALILTFIHGWHHSADVCDANLACFRATLEQIVKLREELWQQYVTKTTGAGRIVDKSRSPGPVIGIYMAWRGESNDGPANFLSYYGRKKVAEHIGYTGGKEALLELDSRYRELNRNGKRVTMVSIGHSFGGALLFSAIEAKMVGMVNGESFIRSSRGRAGSDNALRTGFGDLAILLNPAIESSKLEPFIRELRNPEELYAKDQLPVLLAIASTADKAVGRAFPIGWWVRTILWRQKDFFTKTAADRTGIGRYMPHVTHRLHSTRSLVASRNDLTDCACAELMAIDQIFTFHPYLEYSEGTDSIIPDGPHLEYLTKTDQRARYLQDYRVEHQSVNAIAVRKELSLGVLLAQGSFPLVPTDMSFLEDIEGFTFKPTHICEGSSRECVSPPNAPYVIVKTDETVMTEHNDVFNGTLRKFLIAYIQKYTQLTDKPAMTHAR